MNKPTNLLEQYLQQVCRSMGGPRALREHVRQELREHLLDAATQHQASGLSAEAAMDRALQEFGQPEVVRSELEATHGHRMMMAVVLDKALEWKERTMKAKWLWTTWTYLMVVGIIALEIFFLFFQFVYIIPKIKKLRSDGYIHVNRQTDSVLTWMVDFLDQMCNAAEWVTWWLVLIILAAWGLFEWRVKSENKTFIRLSVLTSAAMGLLVVMVLMAGSLIVLPLVSMPEMQKLSQPWMAHHVSKIEASLTAAQQAAEKADRPAMDKEFQNIFVTLKALSDGPALAKRIKSGDPASAEAMQKAIEETQAQVRQALEQLSNKDDSILEKLVKDIEKAFEPMRGVGKTPER